MQKIFQILFMAATAAVLFILGGCASPEQLMRTQNMQDFKQGKQSSSDYLRREREIDRDYRDRKN